MKWLALVMSAVYLVVGALLLVDQAFFSQITQFRTPLGALLVLYGIVRGVMWRRKEIESRKRSE